MAAATITKQQIDLTLMEWVDDLAGAIMRRADYRALIATNTVGNVNQTITTETVGDGWWSEPLAFTRYYTNIALQAGQIFAADHHYLLGPMATIRALTALRQASTTTSVDENTQTLTDSTANYGAATAVAPGDLVIFTTTGALAEVESVPSSTSLALTPLTWNVPLVAGMPYLIGRAPGTDTTSRYVLEGKLVNFGPVILAVLRRLLLLKSRQPSVSVGDLALDNIYDRLNTEYETHWAGVGYAC